MTLPLFTSSKNVPCIFSPISRVRTEVAALEVREIYEVGAPPFSLVSADPASVLGGPFLSSWILRETPSRVTTLTLDLPETPIADRSKTGDEDRPNASSDP